MKPEDAQSVAPLLCPEAVEALLDWYAANRRELPWRGTADPYRIWISEIMLQQTRVEAVKPYYARFLAELPDVAALAAVPEQRLMKLWEGLGYYSRARNLQKAAKTVMERYGGQIPADEAALRSLCGVGDYTAGAIASIAFGIRAPAVDGNVLRVLARFCGSYDDIARQETKKKWSEALRSSIPADAGSFTQAMIDIGATFCVPRDVPRCRVRPLAARSVAAREQLTGVLPVRSGKKPRRVEELTVLLIRDGARTALHRRPSKGLLAGLYELPNLPGHLTQDKLPDAVRALGFEPLRVRRIEDARHIFTHVEWHMIAYTVQIAPEFDGARLGAGMLLVDNGELRARYAVPSAFSAYTKYLS